MFTTKHHSENGIISVSVAMVSLTALILCIMISYVNAGEVTERMGAAAMFAALGNLIGMIAGIIGLRERDVFRWMPTTGLSMNGVLLLIWGWLILWGTKGI